MQLNLIINVLVAVIFALIFAIYIVVEVYRNKLHKANERIATLEKSNRQYRKSYEDLKDHITDLTERLTAEVEARKKAQNKNSRP